jgi:hypothetical protein
MTRKRKNADNTMDKSVDIVNGETEVIVLQQMWPQLEDTNDEMETTICKKRRLDKGIWHELDKYIEPATNAYVGDDNANDANGANGSTDDIIWVSPSQLKNYFLNDTIIDWFKVIDRQNYKTSPSSRPNSTIYPSTTPAAAYTNFFMSSGLEFEEQIYTTLKNLYPNDIVKVVDSVKDVSAESCNKTQQYLQSGVPILYQAPLMNNDLGLRGCSDLIIRSDWIPKLFKNHPLADSEISTPCKLASNYHYRVIDIKWVNMKLAANGITMLSSGIVPAYQAQCGIYNLMLGYYQDYWAPATYILGRGYNYMIKRIKYTSYSSWDKLGTFHYDPAFISRISSGIKWLRTVAKHGTTWTIDHNIPELYPNMCNKYDSPYRERKQVIAKKMGELTTLWNIGITQRRFAHSQGIKSYYHPECSAVNLGIKSDKNAAIINNFINTSVGMHGGQNTNGVNRKICNNVGYWQTVIGERNIKYLDFFLDFETVPNSLVENNITSTYQIVFMIGVGHIDELGQWQFANFTTIKKSFDSQLDIFLQFFTYINHIKEQYINNDATVAATSNSADEYIIRMFHWSNAEIAIINKFNSMSDYLFDNTLNNIIFIDLLKIFKDIPIFIKNALSFSLKDIARAMFNEKLIETCWDDNSAVSNGYDAMIKIIPLMHIDNLQSEHYNLINDIARYNEIDCKVLMEILSFMRIFAINNNYT